MLQRTSRGLPAAPVVTTFEQFETARRFDLVYAGAAWHWTDPATRWARAVKLLVPGGVLALFGSPAELADPVLAAAVHEIEKQVLPDDDPAVVNATRGRSRRWLPQAASSIARDASWPGL